MIDSYWGIGTGERMASRREARFGDWGRWLSACFVCGLTASAFGQGDVQQGTTRTWASFQDSVTSTVCEVVHAANAELLVEDATNHLILVSGPDITLSDTFVDPDGNVLFEGQPAGVIEFQQDGDGNRSLWWTGLTGEVVSVNGFTGEPTPTDKRPVEFRNLSCEGCDYWDDPVVCADPPEEEPEEPVTVKICGQDVMFPIAMMMAGLMSLRWMGLVPSRRNSVG